MVAPDELFKKIKMLEALAKMPLSNPHPVVSMDLSGILLFRNQAYVQFVETLGSEAPLLREKLFEYCGMAFRDRKNLTTELIFGPRSFLMSAVPDFSDSSTVFYLMETTKQKQLEEALKEASRLSTLGEMAGSIAHEINNPLNIIKVNAYFIERSLNEGSLNPADAMARSTKIKEMVDRISVIIKTLKSFSRKQAIDQKRMIEVSGVFKTTEELMHLRLKGNRINLSFDVDPSIKVYVSEVTLSQVLVNLINNSIDAIENTSDPWIKVTAKRQDGVIVVDVMDSGQGLSEEVREHLFKKTITTKEVGRGTGLGLRITKQIIESFGGTIRIDTECPNTRFVLSLPDMEFMAREGA